MCQHGRSGYRKAHRRSSAAGKPSLRPRSDRKRSGMSGREPPVAPALPLKGPLSPLFPSAPRTSVRPMDEHWLAERLQAGDSIEQIARAVGRHPSTVSYWVNKHGLTSLHARKHVARGGLQREDLVRLIESGMSIRQIADELDRSTATIRHWLKRHGLKTSAAQRLRRDGSTAAKVIRDCPRHGWTWFRRIGSQTQY